jgi:hypothetical protein
MVGRRYKGKKRATENSKSLVFLYILEIKSCSQISFRELLTPTLHILWTNISKLMQIWEILMIRRPTKRKEICKNLNCSMSFLRTSTSRDDEIQGAGLKYIPSLQCQTLLEAIDPKSSRTIPKRPRRT